MSPDIFPTVIWSDPNENSELDDRAAVYYQKDNKIIANRFFQGILDVTDHFIKQYPDAENADKVIKPLVWAGFEQQLIEVVTGALSFKNRPNWNPSDFENALSSEALTTSVMCRYYLMQRINRQVRDQLGKPIDA